MNAPGLSESSTPTPPSYHDLNEASTATTNSPPDTSSGSTPDNRFARNRSIPGRFPRSVGRVHGGVVDLGDMALRWVLSAINHPIWGGSE